MADIEADFDPLDISKGGSLICLCGPPGTGKSHMMKFLLWLWVKKKKLFDYVFAFSGSAHSGDLTNVLPESNVSGFDLDKLQRFVKCAQNLSTKNKYGLLILDDIGYHLNAASARKLCPLWTDFRHSKLTILFCSQYLTQVQPIVRTNTSCFITFTQRGKKKAKMYLYESACLGEERVFKELLDAIEDTVNYPHVALVSDCVNNKYHFMRAPSELPTFTIG